MVSEPWNLLFLSEQQPKPQGISRMKSNSAQLWDDLSNHDIKGHSVSAPSMFKRLNNGWKIASTENPVHEVFFSDSDHHDNAVLSIQAAIAAIESEGRIVNENIELLWAAAQDFPPHNVEWSLKNGRIVGELVIFLFRYKDVQNKRKVKSIRYLVTASERMTQRQLNVVSEGAFMTWLNYLSKKDSIPSTNILLVDYTRGTEKWRSAATAQMIQSIFPKIEDYPFPKNLTV